MGINNTKKCTVFLSFSGDAVTCSSWLYWQLTLLSRPRAKNIWRSSAISSELHRRSLPGAPRSFQLSPEVHQKMADFREFGSLTHAAKQDPGNLKQDPSSTINGCFPGVWEIRVRSLTLRAPSCPGNLSTGYPRDSLSQGVWEFEPSSLVD